MLRFLSHCDPDFRFLETIPNEPRLKPVERVIILSTIFSPLPISGVDIFCVSSEKGKKIIIKIKDSFVKIPFFDFIFNLEYEFSEEQSSRLVAENTSECQC